MSRESPGVRGKAVGRGRTARLHRHAGSMAMAERAAAGVSLVTPPANGFRMDRKRMALCRLAGGLKCACAFSGLGRLGRGP